MIERRAATEHIDMFFEPDGSIEIQDDRYAQGDGGQIRFTSDEWMRVLLTTVERACERFQAHHE